MSKTRRTATGVLAALALTATTIVIPGSLASPKPPTNGGNGAGSSGQCTGKPADRPASCNSATTKGP
jgi:hypothetical protein